MTRNSDGQYVSAVLLGNNRIYYHNSASGKQAEVIFSSSDTIYTLSLGDLKNDGENYIVFANGQEIEALNLLGSSADNFPFADPLGVGFIGTPLVADFYGDAKSEIIAVTKDGRIFAIDGGTGKIVDDLKLSKQQIVRSLGNLQDKGIIVLDPESKNSFSALPFEETLKSLITKEKDQTKMKQKKLLLNWKAMIKKNSTNSQ